MSQLKGATSDLLDVSNYYLFGVWRNHGDPKIMSMPLMAHGPWWFFSIALFFVAFIKVIGPNYMAERKPLDLKPWLFVFNGLFFGGYGAFFVGASIFTDYGAEGFNCRAADPVSERFSDLVIRLLGYVYLVGKCCDFVLPVLRVLVKKSVSDLQLCHTLFMVLITYLGLIYYPGGIFLLLPYLDGLYYSFLHCYLVMRTPQGEMYLTSQKWPRFLIGLRLFMFAVLFLHGLYFYFQANCGPQNLKVLQISYSALALLLLRKEYRKQALKEERRRA